MPLPDSQRLLKANAVRELGTRVAFNFDDLQHQGEGYLAKVRGEANALIQAAQKEAAEIRETARKAGWDAGRREGLTEAGQQIETQAGRVVEQRLSERLQTTLPAVGAIAQALRQELDGWRIRWETAAIQTAVAIAEKIMHRTLDQQPEIAAGMVTEALRLAAGHPQLRIHLHPADIQHLGQHAEDIVRSLTACADAALIPDPAINRGGCRIETRHGEIDARLDTMLARIAEELLM